MYQIKEILKNKKYAKPIIFILLLVALILIYRERHPSNKIVISHDIPIEAAAAKTKDLPVYISALGTVNANSSVDIKTQVNGELIYLGFKDGQRVKKGELLAQIDPRPYQAQVIQYEGQLTRDQAILDNSFLDLERYQELWKQNSTSKQTLDTQIALVEQNEGTVQLDLGLLEGAAVNLSYCNIVAPFDGQVGISNVTEGALLKTSDQTPIVTLTSMNPATVLFSIPEVDLPMVNSEFKKNNLVVKVYDQSFKTLLDTGELIAIDNQIDTSTGTIKLEAKFKNEDYNLFPNQFVNVKLLVKTLQDVVVVPTPSIQYGPNGTFVYLVDEDKTHVKVQPVVTDITSGTDTAVAKGISENQIVAVTGVDKLRDGVSIVINNSGF